MNPTVDWLLFTDDRTKFNYPPNVKVTYCTFEDIKNKAQACFDFPIVLNRPYKLCDYKAAYGDIFKNELTGYDYWGMCDLDLVWGNIREFLTDEILEKYDRIGNQGHSTLFKNNPDVNLRYKKCIDGLLNYREVYTSEKSFCFDESGLDAIYNAYGIYALSVVLQDEVWFVSGMVLCIFSVNVSNKAKKGVAVGIVFLAMSGLLLRGEVPNLTSSFLLGVLACASVILMTKAYQDNLAENCVFKFMSKYTMPVFLMHTICAAPTRSILFKIGITSAWIHIPIGLAVSFGGPILVAIVLKKMKYAEFILYPGKFVRF